MTDKNIFIGTGLIDKFCVFSAACIDGAIAIGDSIRGDFLGDKSFASWGKNLTQDIEVYLYYESGECDYKSAMKLLKSLSNRSRIQT